MTWHIDEDRLNDFKDGLLDPEEDARTRSHLDSCAECRDRLDALTRLLEDLQGMPVEAQPARDLWPQIAWRMEGVRQSGSVSEGETEGLPLVGETSGEGRVKGSRRVSLPAWQLLAASIALIVISGGSVWAILSGGPGAASREGVGIQTPAQLVGWEEAYGGYDEAVADLESVLEEGRAVLEPETVRVLEESLSAINLAIEEARRAMAEDPASPVLQRLLADNLRRKMDLLRQAAVAVYANT
jgi:hypothetical protein